MDFSIGRILVFSLYLDGKLAENHWFFRSSYYFTTSCEVGRYLLQADRIGGKEENGGTKSSRTLEEEIGRPSNG